MAIGTGAALLGSAGAGLLGGAMSSNAAKQAAQTSANAQLESARIAADAAKFRPVGITTRFGQSNFGFTPEGYLSSAGYTVSPELKAIQDQLMGQAGAYDTARIGQVAEQNLMPGAQGLFNLGTQLVPTSTAREVSPEARALAAQYSAAQQGLMPSSYTTAASPEATAYADQLRSLSSSVLPTSYDTAAAAQKYMSVQQGLLAPQREQQLANLRNQGFQTGRSGLAVGGTSAGNLQQANPEMAAYYNALAQQDAALAANAEQVARSNLVQDINLGTQLGGTALSTQTQAEQLARQNMLQNLQTSLGLGQQAYGLTTSAEDLARSRFAQDLGLGTGLYQTGAGMLGQIPSLTTQGYGPLQTQLGLASTIEQLGQTPLDIGAQLGGRSATAGATQAQALLAGGLGAAKTLQAANQYSPMGGMLSGVGNTLGTNAINSWLQNQIGQGSSSGWSPSWTSGVSDWGMVGSGGPSTMSYANLAGDLNAGLLVP